MSKSDEEIVEAIRAVIFDEIWTAYERNWRWEDAKDLIENIECGPIARAAYRVARAHVLDEAAAVLNQAADEANAECDHAHYEGDTGAWVCTRRGGCDCEAIQYQADKHRTAILALKDRTP